MIIIWQHKDAASEALPPWIQNDSVRLQVKVVGQVEEILHVIRNGPLKPAEKVDVVEGGGKRRLSP